MATTDKMISYPQLVSILRARRGLLLAVLAGVLGVVTLASVLLPKRFTATAAVVVDGRTKDAIDGTSFSSLAIPGYLATQVGILKSERVSLLVIDALKLAEDTELRQRWESETDSQGDYRSWLATRLLKKLEAKPARESSVIEIAFTGRDPKQSAEIANAYLEAYVRTALDMQVQPSRQFNGFFDERTKQARDDLESAQRKLSAYQREHGLLATDERLDIETTRLNELSTQLVVLQALASDSRSRDAQSARNRDTLPEVLSDHVVSGIRADLTRQQSLLREMSTRFGDKHPQLVQIRANIAELENKLNIESAKVASSLSVSKSINVDKVAQMAASLDQQRAKVLRMKAQRDEASMLQRDVENAQRTYDTLLTRVTQTNLESQSAQTNVSVLKYATEPGEASFPRLGLNLGIGAVVGMLLALAVVLFKEMRDRRIYIEEDIVRGLSQPLLAVLPVVAHAKIGRTSQARTIGLKQRVLGLPRTAE